MVSGPWHQRRRSFFVHASLSSNHPCFECQISKTRRYTNVVCCEVKILHSELFHGSSAVPKLSGANTGGYIVRPLFRRSFSVSHVEKALLSHTYLCIPQTPRHTSSLEVCMWQCGELCGPERTRSSSHLFSSGVPLSKESQPSALPFTMEKCGANFGVILKDHG